ncbi:MAG: 1-acyl-sn-glycerol-3-phosphate acyltransferase [Oscillospiraceae bacterium]|nr:1-acyl-sn-glycerol-3-phosphate acyltransferase [Oscillospiraceae bacterium]
MAKNSNKKRKDLTIRPVSFLYRLAIFLFGIYLRIFRHLHIDRSELKDVKPPYFLICNHQSMVDFGAAALVCKKDLISFVVSTHFFRDPVLSIGLKLGGCIPKRQFFPDLSAVRKMLRAVRSGLSVGIFPEGQTCYSGQCNDIDPAIGKLVKAMDVPVVNIQIRGNFLTAPKYANGAVFPGYTVAKGSLLLSKEEIDSLSDSEIADRIAKGLAYDEYEWQRKEMHLSRRPRTVNGLENILWLCPKCGKEHAMQTDGPYLYCTECGYRVQTDEYGFLKNTDGTSAELDTPPKWYNWQKEQLEKQLDAGTLLPLTLKGRFLESAVDDFSESGYGCHGEGTATLDKDGLTLDVTRDGEPFTYKVNPGLTFSLTHTAALWAFDIPGNTKEDRDFAFDPEDSRDMMKFVQAWTIVRERYYS